MRAFVAVEIPARVGKVEKCEIADGRNSASARILPPQIAVLGRQNHSVEYNPIDQILHAQDGKQAQSQQQSSTYTSAYNSFLHVIRVVIKQIQIHSNPQIIITMRTVKRIGYLTFIGALTLSACSACYWQSKKYIIARQRWDVIKKQLNRDEPESLVEVEDNGLYPFKYVVVKGKLKQGYVRVDRPRGGRMGYLVVRSLAFRGKQGEEAIAAVEGWCEEGHQFEGYESQQKQFRGILRQKQRKDYVHTHFKKTDLQTFKMQTYIDLEGLIPVLKLTPTVLAQNYYMEILKPLDEVNENLFPYQYSVDNFQLPYLTPDKHLSYACFWGGSAMVGLFGIFRAIRLK